MRNLILEQIYCKIKIFRKIIEKTLYVVNVVGSQKFDHFIF